jgi:DNA polymerase-3 subunit epsilon
LKAPSAPARGLRRLAWISAEFASLDFETTGLDLVNDHVVSFGVVPVRNGRIVLGEGVHQLVEPPIPPSPSSVTIHRMRTQDLLGAPTIADATHVLAEALADRFLLTWYATLELAMLRRMFGRRGRRFQRRCIDVRKLALVVGDDPAAASTGSLTQCATHYGVPVAAPHEAFDDALVTAQLFLVLVSRLGDGGTPSVRDLLRAGR